MVGDHGGQEKAGVKDAGEINATVQLCSKDPARATLGGLGGLRNPRLGEPGPEGGCIAAHHGKPGAQFGPYYDFSHKLLSIPRRRTPIPSRRPLQVGHRRAIMPIFP